MVFSNQPAFKSLEKVEGKVIPYEVFRQCQQEAEPNADLIQRRREQLTAHYTQPAETVQERSAMLLRHYTHPEI